MNTHGMRLALLWLAAIATILITAKVFAAETPKVTFDTQGAAPREVEEQTQQSIVRDYGKAWQTLAQALQTNHPELLTASFAGFARDDWEQAIKAQAKSGLSRKVVDHGHKLKVLFYSVEGSSMQLSDTAQLEIQYLDGSKVVHSEQVTAHYIVLVTPAENSWKVRLLQEVPAGSTQQAALRGSMVVREGGK